MLRTRKNATDAEILQGLQTGSAQGAGQRCTRACFFRIILALRPGKLALLKMMYTEV